MDKYLSLHHKSIITALIMLGSLVLLFFFLKSILNILLLMYLAIILAEGIRPLINDLEKTGLPQSLAVLLIFIILLSLLIISSWLLTAPLVQQLQSLVNQLPEYNTKAQAFLSQDHIFKDNQVFEALKEQLGSITKNVASNVIVVPKYIFNFFFNTFVVFFLSYFWLTSTSRFEEFGLKFIPLKHRGLAKEVASEISTNIGSYLRGVLVMMVFVGLISGLVVWLLDLPFALVLGLVAGLTEAIPIIGPFVGAIPAVIVALFISPGKAVIVAVFYLILQQIEGNILVPAVMNKILKLEPLVILISVLVGTSLLGITGAFLAVPTASVIQTILNKLLFPRLQNS